MNFDGTYSIYINKKFTKSVSTLPKHIKGALDEKLKYFADNPFYPSLNTKPYPGMSDKTKKRLGIDEVYEFYINRKKYRCLLYVIHESKSLVLMCVGTHEQLKKYVRNA